MTFHDPHPITPTSVEIADFDEELGQEIIETWLLHKLTDESPPTAADLYEKLGEARG